MTEVFNRRINQRVKLAIRTPSKTAVIGGKLNNYKINPLQQSIADASRSKLVRAEKHRVTKVGDDYLNEQIESNSGYFDNVSDDIALSIKEAEDIQDALPDIRLAKQILVSAILSPNDMISKELIYSCDSTIFGDSVNALLDVVRDYFDNDYKIKDKLPEILEKALITEGSYISVILPESSVDNAINSNLVVSNESSNRFTKSMGESMGFLGKSIVPAQEALKVEIHDNYELFKLPKLQEKIIDDRVSGRVKSKLIAGIESKLEDIYPNREDAHVNILHMKSLKDLEKPTVGHPLEIIVPPEAFIPVYVPGDPSNHKGAFILLDASGNPISKRGGNDQQADLHQSFKTAVSDLASNLITATSDKMMSVDASKMSGGYVDHEYVSKVYGVLLERELKDKLSSGGVYTSNLDVGVSDNIMRVMFARACKRLQTKLVYVPESLFTYLAFSYKDNGTGRSILEQTKAVSSLRMVQEIADSLANIRNAIDHKEVTFNIDPADPDPMKTVNEMLHSVQRSTKAQTPIGLLNLNDIANAFQKNGWNVRTQGHEAMPDMYVEYSQRTMSYPEPNTDYSDKLRERHMMSMGLAPDSVSGVMDVEYATNILSANIFLARDALEKQGVYGNKLTDKTQKYTRNSSLLMTDITKIIKENRHLIQVADDGKYSDEILAVLFVNNLRISLPAPDLSKLDMQLKALQTYSQMLDEVLPHLISEDIITSENMGEDVSGVLTEVIAVVKSTLIRAYMSDNNIVPEAFKMLFNQSEDNSQMDLLRVHQNYLDSIKPILQEYIARSIKRKHESEVVMQKVREKLGAEDDAGYGDSGSDYGDDNTDEGGDDDMMGGFDMDGLGMGEEEDEGTDEDDTSKDDDTL